MPELAEVRYFSRRWRPGLGEKVCRVHSHAGKRVFRGISLKKLHDNLAGQRLTSIRTHGKQMLFRFGRDRWLGIHLGMTGKLASAPRGYRPDKHDHLILYTPARALVFSDPRLFGRIRLERSPRFPCWWSSLPPEPLSPDFSTHHLQAFLRRRSRTPLKPLLLLQQGFPGIGNWMADEILWQSRLHPCLRAGQLPITSLPRFHASIRRICREAVRIIGRDWSDPPRSWLFLHRWKDGGQCPRCRQALIRKPVGGRTTCWCPRCQKAALPRGRSRS